MYKFILAFTFPLIFVSCQSYKNNFDCPPGEGVPCTSVTTLEKMIVETDVGEDVFLGQKLSGSQKGFTAVDKDGNLKLLGRRIWVADLDCNGKSNNHYIFISE